MLKKCMAVMLVIIMAMSGVSAAAETNIIFDLDISSYCNEDGGGTNSRTILKNGLIPVRHSHENGIEYINLDGRGGFTASVPSSYEELTIEMWVKLDEGETETPLLVLYNETETITGLNAAGNKAILLGDSQSDLNSVEWTHLALTLKQSNDTINRCLYINGSAAAEDTATAALSSITDMNIFAYSDKYTDGAIGKFTVYDEICDIQSLYNADKNKFEGEDTDPVYIPVLAGGDADTAPQLISYENQMN